MSLRSRKPTIAPAMSTATKQITYPINSRTDGTDMLAENWSARVGPKVQASQNATTQQASASASPTNPRTSPISTDNSNTATMV